MKRFAVIGLLTFFLFAGCGDMLNSGKRELDTASPVESLTIYSINSSFTAMTPLVSSESSPVSILGIDKAVYTIHLQVEPEEAPWMVTWTSSNPAVRYDQATFQIVGEGVGEALLTFSTVGKMKDGSHATYDVWVKSSVVKSANLIGWNFNTAPQEWVDTGLLNGNTTITGLPDVEFMDKDNKGYCFSILANTDMTMNGSGWRIGRTILCGMIRATAGPEGQGFAGPFNVMVVYSNGGGTATDPTNLRYPIINVGGVLNPAGTAVSGGTVYNGTGQVSNGFGGARTTMVISYTGTGAQPVYLQTYQGIWIHELSIERLQ